MNREKIINEAFDEAITEVWNDDDYYDIGYNSGLEEGRRIAIDLLKEQEAVEPKTTITYNGFHYDYCGNCDRLLPVAQDFEKANYCPSCGRMVKWE